MMKFLHGIAIGVDDTAATTATMTFIAWRWHGSVEHGVITTHQAALERKGTFKVEFLQRIEKEVQAKWEAEKIFENNAPATPRKSRDEKFYATFPYPYMNGRLHLGHAFTVSKAEVSDYCFVSREHPRVIY